MQEIWRRRSALLRILYVVLALGFGGLGLAVTILFNAITVVDFTREWLTGIPNPNYSHFGYWNGFGRSSLITGPLHFSILLLSGFFALRRRWNLLALSSWFLMAPLASGMLYGAWLIGWRGVFMLYPSIESIAYLPCLGLLLCLLAKSPVESVPARAPAASKISMSSILAIVAALSYFSRAVVLTQDSRASWAIDHLKGTTGIIYPDTEKAFLAGALGVIVAIALLLSVVGSRIRNEAFLKPALVFALGVSFAGFFDLFDVLVGDADGSLLNIYFYDAIAFFAFAFAFACACAFALKLMYRDKDRRMQSVIPA